MSYPNNYYRFKETDKLPNYRSEFDRDYARVLHCPAFRRLQNKTQLFPMIESDFFRNRLTHSLEVAQIAKLIAYKIKSENTQNKKLDIIPQVCEISGLCHDIGHPPFGHNGEKALSYCMKNYGGFEGNAQTLRLLTRLEKKEDIKENFSIRGKTIVDNRVGLNLTARVLASVLKYDQEIPLKSKKFVKGYYATERDIVKKIKSELCGNNFNYKKMKTVECSIMDIADDIAYSTYDLEDIFKAGFLTPYDIISADDNVYKQISAKINKEYPELRTSYVKCRDQMLGIFSDVFDELIEKQVNVNKDKCFEVETIRNYIGSFRNSKIIANKSSERTKLTSKLVNTFINGITLDDNFKNPVLYQVKFDKNTLLKVSVLKYFTYYMITTSSLLSIPKNFGYDVIVKIFKKLSSKDGFDFLPNDIRDLIVKVKDNGLKNRIICDFIACMTDRYAIEYYLRLFSPNQPTIFKPL